MFSQPNPALLTALSAVETAIIPRHLYEGKDYFTNPANAAPVGTGPFVFGEWKHGDTISLRRNPNYWDQPRPYLDGIVYRIVPDMAATAAAFETEEADIGYNNPIPLSDLERFKRLAHIGIEDHGYESGGRLDDPDLQSRQPVFEISQSSPGDRARRRSSDRAERRMVRVWHDRFLTDRALARALRRT